MSNAFKEMDIENRTNCFFNHPMNKKKLDPNNIQITLDI